MKLCLAVPRVKNPSPHSLIKRKARLIISVQIKDKVDLISPTLATVSKWRWCRLMLLHRTRAMTKKRWDICDIRRLRLSLKAITYNNKLLNLKSGRPNATKTKSTPLTQSLNHSQALNKCKKIERQAARKLTLILLLTIWQKQTPRSSTQRWRVRHSALFKIVLRLAWMVMRRKSWMPLGFERSKL